MTRLGWEHAHAELATLFQPAREYAGYKPEVREAPNGDTKACVCMYQGTDVPNPGCPLCGDTGRVPNVDAGLAEKRYLHVARKYDPPSWALDYLARAHWEACVIAERIGVPDAFFPRTEDGTLRVLEYPSAGHVYSESGHCIDCRESNDTARGVCPARPAGAGTAEHTDMDLFTVNLWRSTPEDHEHYEGPYNCGFWKKGTNGAYHVGEIGELVGLGPAVLHRVPARPYTQRALVYFAMPSHAALLEIPDGSPIVRRTVTVGEWLAERIARSRVPA